MKKMDEEYIRLLNSNKLQELFDCRSGYMDQNDCTCYHENWMLLRYLGVVSNPFWHEKFYENAIQQYVNQLDKVLILGTADFSMPYLCQMKGIKKLKICDICRTPLNICQNVAKANNFSWEVEQKNVFEGIDEKYDAVINDAFITRFEYDKKRIVLEKIWDSLRDEGVYITTMRNDWNYGNAIVPNSAEKESFIEKAVHSAERKNIDSKKAKVAASRYIEKMKSYPIRDEKMLENLIDGLFNIVYIGKGRVEGECTRTTYFRLILQKQSKKSKKV